MGHFICHFLSCRGDPEPEPDKDRPNQVETEGHHAEVRV